MTTGDGPGGLREHHWKHVAGRKVGWPTPRRRRHMWMWCRIADPSLPQGALPRARERDVGVCDVLGPINKVSKVDEVRGFLGARTLRGGLVSYVRVLRPVR